MTVAEFEKAYPEKPIDYFKDAPETACHCEVYAPVFNPAPDLEVARFGANHDNTRMKCWLKI